MIANLLADSALLPRAAAALIRTATGEAAHSPLIAHSAEAAQSATLMWVLFIGAASIFLIVTVLAILALRSRRPAWMKERALIVGGGIAFPVVVLLALFLYSLGLGPGRSGGDDPNALRLEVTGEMWWWRVRYLNRDGSLDFVTANEIHVPAGRPVEIALTSADVIHSFWVPGLASMLDMIPGRVNTLRFSADRAARLRGQCNEFCGLQHARMAFDVQVHDQREFEQWAAAQRQSARAPDNDVKTRGQSLFISHCALCHAVRGTEARGEAGPDLTHVGSRKSIAAGMLPNNVGTLAGWIASSQHLKPGNRMPSFEHFPGPDLTALAAYVESLQ